ncbi:MAG: hypothetical protein WEA11_00370 [Acidimicrobiales bacterium]
MSSSQTKLSLVGRLAHLPKPDGPHARLGVLWFILACAACALGTAAVAVVFAVVSAVAAMQTVRAWDAFGKRSNPVLAGLFTAVVPIVALWGPIGFGAGLIVLVGAMILGSVVLHSDVVVGLRAALLPAVAAGSVVLIARADMGALVVLLVLVSVYEIGDYLMGSEAGSVFEGPLCGIAAVMVVTFAAAVLQLGPFETGAAWVFGSLAAVLAPLGAPLASALAPSAQSSLPALRRLDVWLVVTPVWGLMLGNYLAQNT